jgi:hypothetical protein
VLQAAVRLVAPTKPSLPRNSEILPVPKRSHSGFGSLLQFLGHSFHWMKRTFGSQPIAPVSRDLRPALGPLQLLECRRLPSVSAFGPQFRVNTFTQGSQQLFAESQPAVASDSNGNFVAVWSSGNQDGNSWGVYAQRFNSAGAPQGSEFRVNTTTLDHQDYATVAMRPTGEFAITWASKGQDGSGWGVYAQRYDAAGTPLGGEFRVNSTTNNDQERPAIAMDATGGFVIAWQSKDQDGNNGGIYGQRYDAVGNPQGGEFQVNTFTTNEQENPAVGMNAAGNFVITWSSQNQDGSGDGVYAQRYSAAGLALGSEFRVNTTTTDNQKYSAVALDAVGNFVIAWQSKDQDGDDYGVYAQRFDAAGNQLGSEFRVNTFTNRGQEAPAVAMDSAGNFVITWSSKGQDSGDSYGIYAQRYDAAGTPVGAEFRVNTITANDQEHASVALDSGGNFVVIWSGNGPGDGSGVFGQVYQAAGITVSPTAGLQTNEAGGTASFKVVLNTQPSAAVVIALTSTDPSEGTVVTPPLTFTPADWNVAQVVIVTGTDDAIADGNVAYTIVTAPAISGDPLYDGVDAADVAVTNNDDESPGITVTPTSGLVTTEAGGTASFSVVLNSAPVSAVAIPISSSNPAEGTVSTSSLTFTTLDWNLAQTVSVTGVNDTVADGDAAFWIVTGPASTLDPMYTGLDPSDVAVTNRDDDSAGVSVTSSSGPTTEPGGTATFSVVLNSQPKANVTIGLSSSNLAEGTLSASALTFTSANWNIAQTVTVTGVDDFVADGDMVFATVTSPAGSADPSYDALDAADVDLTNLNDDTAGITVTPTAGLITSEGGGQASFTVVLTSQPLNDVTIDLVSTAPEAGILSQTSLTFSAAEWNTPKQVTVTGGTAGGQSGPISYKVEVRPAQSPDPSYGGVDPSDVSVTHQPANGSSPKPEEVPTVILELGHLQDNPLPAASASVQDSAQGLTSATPANSIPITEPAAAAFTALASFTGVGPSDLNEDSSADGGRAGLAARTLDIKRDTLVSFVKRSESSPPLRLVDPAPSAAMELFDFLPADGAAHFAPESRTPGGSIGPFLGSELLWDSLDRLDEQVTDQGELSETSAFAATGLIATTGYVLLNTRAGYWLLSLLSAKPLWQEFDPLEVLYVWEKEAEEKGRQADEDDESLLSLVE